MEYRWYVGVSIARAAWMDTYYLAAQKSLGKSGRKEPQVSWKGQQSAVDSGPAQCNLGAQWLTESA